MRIFLAVMLLSCISFAQNDADAAIAKAKAAAARTMFHSASKPVKAASFRNR